MYGEHKPTRRRSFSAGDSVPTGFRPARARDGAL